MNYDEFYERALYDKYRETLSDYTQRRQIWCDDLWNKVPAEYFTDTTHHMDAMDWKIVTDYITDELQKVPQNATRETVA